MKPRSLTMKMNRLDLHRVPRTLFWIVFIGLTAGTANITSAAPAPGTTTLEVQVPGDPDAITWGHVSTIDTARSLRFQWSTKEPGATSAVWRVGNAPFGDKDANARDVASGQLSTVPDPGKFASFWIDFKSFLQSPPKYGPVKLYVKLWVLDSHGKTVATSNSVKIIYEIGRPAFDFDGDAYSELEVRIDTVSENLNGGLDNLDITIDCAPRPDRVERNVNHGLEWKPGSVHFVTIKLKEPLWQNLLHSITFKTTTLFADGWDMHFRVSGLTSSGKKTSLLVDKELHRFTFPTQQLTVSIPPYKPKY